MLFFRMLALATAFSWVVWMPLSLADDPQPEIRGQVAGQAEPVIEEIIVTATRREVALASVPLSVHVLTDKQLQDIGALSFRDYARNVPGLFFNDDGFGGEAPKIRGVSTVQGSEVNPTTAVYLGEVPITHAGGGGLPYSPDPMLVDIERIEVLRGPQGTLFGASSMGGAIRIITKPPDVANQESFLEAGVSTIKDGGTGYELRGMVNLPREDERAALRLVVFQSNTDGFIDNATLDEDDVNTNEVIGGRLAGTFLFTDRVSVTGMLMYQDRKSDGTDIDEFDDPDRMQTRFVREPNEDEWVLYNLLIDADFGSGKLISSTGYLDRKIDTRLDVTDFFESLFVTGTTFRGLNQNDVREFTQEVRVFSDTTNRFSWLLGAFYQDQTLDFGQDFISPGFDAVTGGLASMFGPSDNLFSSRLDSGLKQFAVYGDMGFLLGAQLEATLGLRWFEIDRDYYSSSTGLINGGPSTVSGDANENGVTPKISLNYMPTDDLTVYGTIAKGFRPGGVNSPEASDLPECVAELAALGFSGFPVEYDSDTLWSYEVGARGNWADGRAHFDAAVYHIDWSDMQTGKVLNCGLLFSENSGKASSDGAEISFTVRPSDRVEIDLTGTYIDAKLAENVPNLGGQKGDPIPGVPDFTAAIGVSYYPPPIAGLDNTIRVDYQHVGRSYSTFDSTNRITLPAYDTTNLRYSLVNERWTATIFVENLFDEKGVVYIEDSILGTWATTIPPQTLGVTARWNF